MTRRGSLNLAQDCPPQRPPALLHRPEHSESLKSATHSPASSLTAVFRGYLFRLPQALTLRRTQAG